MTRPRVQIRNMAFAVSTFTARSVKQPRLVNVTIPQLLRRGHEVVDEKRREFPGFSFARYSDTRSTKCLLGATAIVLDYDGISERAAAQVFSRLKQLEVAYGPDPISWTVLMCSVTPSSRSLSV